MKSFFSKNLKGNFFEGMKVFFYLVLVSFILLWPSFWNGYPLVFSDTGTYIASAFLLKVPLDRPIGYGYFIRLFSGGVSLWFVVYAQAFFAAYLLWKIVRVFVQKSSMAVHFCSIFALSFSTIVPWMASEIMPDIFPPLIFLILFVFVVSKELRIVERIFLIFLLMFFLITHVANFLLSLAFLLLGFLAVFFLKRFAHYRKDYLKRMAFLGAAILFAPLFFLYSNAGDGHGYVLNPSSHVFIMSRVNEAGILDDYLLGHCANAHYFLCPYQGRFPQSDQFIWAKESPANLEGWPEAKSEYDKILHDVFTDPVYIAIFAKDSAYRSLKLFFMFGMDNYYPYREQGPVYPKIEKYLRSDLASFTGARQYRGEFEKVDGFALLFILTGLTSVFWIIWMFFAKAFHSEEKFFAQSALIFLAVNAGIMGTLSGVYGRYQERAVWLLVFIPLIFIFRKLIEKAR